MVKNKINTKSMNYCYVKSTKQLFTTDQINLLYTKVSSGESSKNDETKHFEIKLFK